MQGDVNHWSALEAEDVVRKLDTDVSHGLTTDEVSRRLQQFGPNILAEMGQINYWKLFISQFASTLVAILLAACVVSASLHDYIEAIAILVIVILNAILAFVQEYRAEKAMAALLTFATPIVRVRRDGQLQEVSSKNLVPGDVVLLEAGNIAQADCRITQSVQLRMQEAVLTGESESVDKTSEALPDQPLPIADRHNSLYGNHSQLRAR